MNEITNPETGEIMEVLVERDGKMVVTRKVLEAIHLYEAQKKAIDEAYEVYRTALKGAMEKHGLKKIIGEDVTITYIAPTTMHKLDSKAVKKHFPEIYERFSTESERGAQLRIKVENGK